MKFSRVNKKTIHCIVSENELNAHGLEVEDLFEDKEKTESFLRKVVIKASQELDVDVDGNAYSAQLSIREDGNISIILIEDDGSLHQMMSKLWGHLGWLKDKLSENNQEVESEPAIEKEASEVPLWIEVLSLEDAVKLCQKLPAMDGIDTELYKFESSYLLRIAAVTDTRKLGGIILTASEYAIDMFTDNNGGRYVMEHGKLIHKNAVETLKMI